MDLKTYMCNECPIDYWVALTDGQPAPAVVAAGAALPFEVAESPVGSTMTPITSGTTITQGIVYTI